MAKILREESAKAVGMETTRVERAVLLCESCHVTRWKGTVGMYAAAAAAAVDYSRGASATPLFLQLPPPMCWYSRQIIVTVAKVWLNYAHATYRLSHIWGWFLSFSHAKVKSKFCARAMNVIGHCQIFWVFFFCSAASWPPPRVCSIFFLSSEIKFFFLLCPECCCSWLVIAV